MALPPHHPQRIQIIGPSCAGKTTLARTLGQRLGLLVTDLDELWRYQTLADEPALAAARVTRLAGPGDLARWLDTLAPATLAPPSPAHAADAV